MGLGRPALRQVVSKWNAKKARWKIALKALQVLKMLGSVEVEHGHVRAADGALAMDRSYQC